MDKERKGKVSTLNVSGRPGGSWPKGCEFNPGSRQLLGERGSALVNPSITIWSVST